jgi:glycerol-3-phosphate acyltransferase PlsY
MKYILYFDFGPFWLTYGLAPYLIGSIPFGLLLSKLFGYGDIRKIGSGNIGATNVLRTGNKWLALLTLLLDGLKGFLLVFFIYKNGYFNFCGRACDYPIDIDELFMGGLFVILGHIFPVWLKFKGGKGVATAIGVVFALNPFLGGSIIALWLLAFFISHISSLSALVAFFGTTLIALIAVVNREYAVSDKSYFYYMVVVTL